MKKTAYDLPVISATLTNEEKIEAVELWQKGCFFHPLTCGICGNELVAKEENGEIILDCPTNWCYYKQNWIPNGVISFYLQRKATTFIGEY